MRKFLFSRRTLCCLLLLSAIVASTLTWARWRPAQRFEFQELKANELRLVTWNVGYFAATHNKNLRDVDIAEIVDVLDGISPDAVVLQELSSVQQAETIAEGLGADWHAHTVETGHQGQVLAVLSDLPYEKVYSEEAGGRNMVGVTLGENPEQQMFILGVHSPHPARGMSDTVDNIRGAVAMTANRDEPIRIIAGDMNYNFDVDDTDGPLYQEIMDVLSDSTEALGETYYAHTRIDHVFHFPETLDVVEEVSGMVDLPLRFANVPGFRDHRPIVVTYDMTEML
ncbi:endonuclease/exonuclease/phosphatase family protein [Rubellicoccus peritrichatus]|uniref:Endonuclease/exonuclease/phosphatase family protein n=1 Tax=Rubellicoccus peritrichatus TaxID=3080537 RepID=A0AAQ3LC04_9BACT|nr:endonuclease/exonuclease/phosphatase family protein [Puniceicoccus sp. CR14]WOO41080.1 endonuclease/exonuclease/phosphatase family protein [Puniceicoccus sp. CR14]